MLRVSNIKLSIDDDKSKIKSTLIKKLKIKEKELVKYFIYKESIDARKRGKIDFVYTVDVVVNNESKILKKKLKDVVEIKQREYIGVASGGQKLENRPVVIGSGPAGLFASLVLAQRGYMPIMLERGLDVDNRTKDINNFWTERKFKNNSNVQFGEGGAGTFSDGKLTTRIKDIRCRKVLEEFVNFGAPDEILYANKPHVGTDILKNVVKNIREEIIRLGGSVKFDAKVTQINVEGSKIKSVVVNDEETIETNVVILAIGHSARDTYEMLYEKGVKIIQKPFAIGARIEHPQILINKSQLFLLANLALSALLIFMSFISLIIITS